MGTMRLTVDGSDVGPLLMATTARARSKGLLGRTGLLGAIWLAPARQVHTYRMKFTIDVAYVGRDMTVLYTETMKPGRLGKWLWRSKGVLEASGGAFSEWGLQPGSRLGFTSLDADA
jgi:uncharacterized membrane protein (UPF0127 family)